MALFNRNDKEQVPEIQIQGDEAVIPKPEGDKAQDKETNRFKVPTKSWGHN